MSTFKSADLDCIKRARIAAEAKFEHAAAVLRQFNSERQRARSLNSPQAKTK